MEEHHPKKLLDQVRDAIRLKHYSIRAEQTYIKRSPRQKARAQHPVLSALALRPRTKGTGQCPGLFCTAQIATCSGIAAISVPSAPPVASKGHPVPRSMPTRWVWG
jgi:hypothetical protein